MREIKFRGYNDDFGWITGSYVTDCKNHHAIMDSDCYLAYSVKKETVGQYTGLKDRNGVEIYEGCLLNIFFTSSNREFIHDCIYKVEIGALGDIQFKFVRLLWVDGGHNQYPSSTTLCARYDSLDYEYENNQVKLKVPDSWGENRLHGNQWKCNDKSFYFKVIGNIYENPELLGESNE